MFSLACKQYRNLLKYKFCQMMTPPNGILTRWFTTYTHLIKSLILIWACSSLHVCMISGWNYFSFSRYQLQSVHSQVCLFYFSIKLLTWFMLNFCQCNDSSPHFFSLQRHSYGKGIEGIAYVRFGIIDETENKVFIPGLEQQLSVSTTSVQWNYSDLSQVSWILSEIIEIYIPVVL